MFFKLQLAKKGNDFIYPVPIDAIKNPKYRKDMLRCVCELDYDASSEQGVEEITEEEYNQYPNCTLTTDKTEIQADGADAAVLTAQLPAALQGETITLYDNESGQTLDFADSDINGQANFQLTSTQSGKVFRLIVESDKFAASNEVLIKVI